MPESTAPALSEDEDTRTVIAGARDLLATDWSAAIDLLTDANRRARRDALEIALADLRHHAAEPLGTGSVLVPQPEAGTSPPIGPSRLPETTPSGLTPGALRAAILGHGCLLVRGAIDESTAHDLAGAIDGAFAAQEAWSAAVLAAEEAGGQGSDVPESAWWSRLRLSQEDANSLGRKWIRGASGILLCDSPRLMFDILELYTRLGLATLATEYLGGRPVLSANKCTLRRVPLDTTGGWHQDGRFLGSDIRALNIWVALTPCGVDAPGLDVVPQRLDSFVDAGTEGAYFDWAASDAVAEAAAGPGGVVRPEFGIGDMLLFDEMMLHRTGMSPEMTVERHAIEMWCFAGNAYPAGHVPLAW